MVGAAYGMDEPIAADQLSIQLANLTHWVQSAAYGQTIQTKEQQGGRGWVISSELVEPRTLPIPQGTLRVTQSVGVTGDGVTSRTLTQNAGFHLKFDNPLPLDEVVDLASDLQDLVSIGTDSAAAFERFWLWHPDFFRQRDDGEHVPLPVEYLAEWHARPGERKQPPSDYDMPFTFTELGGLDGVVKWLDVAAKYRTMLGAVMNTGYGRPMFVNDRLLERLAALEGYHRVRTGMEAPGLQLRLSDLTDLAGLPFEQLVGDVAAWRRRASAERNNIAHHKGRPARQSSAHMYFTAACSVKPRPLSQFSTIWCAARGSSGPPRS